jgi:hypothetical protein
VQFGSTLQYGGGYPLNGYEKAHCDFNTAAGQGLHLDYHTYGLDWTPTYLAFRSFYTMDQYWILIYLTFLSSIIRTFHISIA